MRLRAPTIAPPEGSNAAAACQPSQGSLATPSDDRGGVGQKHHGPAVPQRAAPAPVTTRSSSADRVDSLIIPPPPITAGILPGPNQSQLDGVLRHARLVGHGSDRRIPVIKEPQTELIGTGQLVHHPADHKPVPCGLPPWCIGMLSYYGRPVAPLTFPC